MIDQAFIDRFRAFDRFYANILNQFDNDFYGDTMTITEARVMTAVYEQQPVSAKAICILLQMNKGQLSLLLKKLEQKKFLQRQTDTTDRRASLITLTPAGLAVQQASTNRVRQGLQTIFQGYSQGDIRQLDQAIRLFQPTYQKASVYQVKVADLQGLGDVAVLQSQMRPAAELPQFYQQLAAMAKQPDDLQIWRGTVNDEPSGTIVLARTDAKAATIHFWAVRKDQRQHGLGTQLLSAAKAGAQAQNIETLRLLVPNTAQSARNLLVQQGFTLETNQNETTNTRHLEQWKGQIKV